MTLTLSRGKLILCCFITITVIYFLQIIMNSSSHQNTSAPSLSEVSRGQVKKEQKKNINTLTVSDIARLLVEKLKEPTDMKIKVFNTSCKDIPTDTACYDATCPQNISHNPRKRTYDLFKSGKLTLSPAQRDLILSMSKTIPESDVIITSACSSNHYHEMQAMFQSLHQVVYPRLTNFSVVLFDIGLSPEERKMTEKNCKCQVVSFPADIFPPHVKTKHCYSWKPLVVLATISKARKYLVWQDASVRWSENFRTVFDRTYVYGHQMLRYDGSNRVPSHTVKQTFDYMEDQPCAFFPYPEIQGNCMLHKHDPLVVKAVLEPWARCALEKECICPVKPGLVMSCTQDLRIHRCHRFDQSAITIIMAKVYGDEIYRYISPETNNEDSQYISVRRGEYMFEYFKN